MLSAVKTFITTAQNNIMIIETNKQTMRERKKWIWQTEQLIKITTAQQICCIHGIKSELNEMCMT